MQDIYPFGSWSFTIIRAHGLHFLRPEKSWRPIVTVLVSDRDHNPHEVTLGCDGQNPNLKDTFIVQDARSSTKVEIKVWHKSQSKKKSKQRNLISSACLSLGDIHRRQGPGAKSEIRLNACTRPSRRTPARGQGGACVVVKVCPPSPYCSSSPSSSRALSPAPPPYDEGCDSEAGSSDHPFSDSISFPPSPTLENSDSPRRDPNERDDIDVAVKKPKKRRKLGYSIWSDEDADGECSEEDEESVCSPDGELGTPCPEEEVDFYFEGLGEDGESLHISKIEGEQIWMVASLLPTSYADQISIASSMSAAEWILECISPYRHFKDANVDSDWEAILDRLQREWYFIGGSLVSLAALFAAVFGYQSGTLFPVDGLAQRAVAVGSIASGVGISIDAWFIFSYSGADAAKFQRKARDIFGSYFFFCISARVPALCMLTSALALMLFLLVVAWSTWPTAVLTMCFVAGIILTMQFILYGVYRLVRFIVGVVRAVQRGVAWVFTGILRRGRSTEVAGGIPLTPTPPPLPVRSHLRPPPRSMTQNSEK